MEIKSETINSKLKPTVSAIELEFFSSLDFGFPQLVLHWFYNAHHMGALHPSPAVTCKYTIPS